MVQIRGVVRFSKRFPFVIGCRRLSLMTAGLALYLTISIIGYLLPPVVDNAYSVCNECCDCGLIMTFHRGSCDSGCCPDHALSPTGYLKWDGRCLADPTGGPCDDEKVLEWTGQYERLHNACGILNRCFRETTDIEWSYTIKHCGRYRVMTSWCPTGSTCLDNSDGCCDDPDSCEPVIE